VAHELRNPLNGVALNLEVLRGRVGRAQSETSALGGFAEAAVADLAVAIRLADALLAVARPVRQPVELGNLLMPIATLAGAVATARGGSLEVVLPDDLPPEIQADPHAVRAAVATAMLAAAEQGSAIRCRVGYEPAAAVLEVGTGIAIELSEGTVAALAACGIAVSGGGDGLELRIPRTVGAASSTQRERNAESEDSHRG
jgi:hypothetical protein